MVLDEVISVALLCSSFEHHHRPTVGCSEEAQDVHGTVVARLEALAKYWTEPQTFDGRLWVVGCPVDSNISLGRKRFWIHRPAGMSVLTASMQTSGTCAIHGIGGVGKSILAAQFAYESQ